MAKKKFPIKRGDVINIYVTQKDIDLAVISAKNGERRDLTCPISRSVTRRVKGHASHGYNSGHFKIDDIIYTYRVNDSKLLFHNDFVLAFDKALRDKTPLPKPTRMKITITS